jgi:hypothetical protein
MSSGRQSRPSLDAFYNENRWPRSTSRHVVPMKLGQMQKSADPGQGNKGAERRRHPRVPLGVPVRVHMAGQPSPKTIELVEVSGGGGSFRMKGTLPTLGQRVAFGFVTPDHSMCAACGRVVRIQSGGFALQLERASRSFRSFVADISGPFIVAA